MISGRSTKHKVQEEEIQKHCERHQNLIQKWETCRVHPSTRSGTHEGAFRPHWFDTVLLILYAVFYFMYKLCGTPKEMSSPLLQVPQAWNAQGSFWKHEKCNKLRLGEALTFKTTSEVDGDTSEQPRTTSISEVIKCRGWATAVVRRWGKKITIQCEPKL